nr:phosphoenolpyruvate-protein phosphotransferase [Salmonella sp. NCTC 7297]
MGNIRRLMVERHLALGAAIIANMEQVCSQLSASASDYLRERVSDICDITEQLLRITWPEKQPRNALVLMHPTILVAEDLTPSQFLSLDLQYLSGMILEKTGRTSHTLILARASAIPVLSGLAAEAIGRYATRSAVLDAQTGVLTVSPDTSVRGYYAVAQKLADKRQQRQACDAALLACTQDNQRIDIAANIGTALEAPGAFSNGAEGIACFVPKCYLWIATARRMSKSSLKPTNRFLLAAGEKPVIFRTMDIGGDKKYLLSQYSAGREPFSWLPCGAHLS